MFTTSFAVWKNCPLDRIAFEYDNASNDGCYDACADDRENNDIEGGGAHLFARGCFTLRV